MHVPHEARVGHANMAEVGFEPLTAEKEYIIIIV